MTVIEQNGGTARKRPIRVTRLQQEARIGLLFLCPWIVGFVLLKALPILAALVFSLTEFKMLTPETTSFIGLEDYARFFDDTLAGASLFGSLGYFLLTVPLEMVVALVLAAIFTSSRLKNRNILRTLVFMTSIIPSTSIFFIFLGSLEYAQRLIFTPMKLPPIEGYGLLMPPEAEQQARRSVELVPGSAAAHRVLGQILLSKARDKEGIEAALPELKRANELQPAEPSGALALGQAYLRLDRPAEAGTVS